MYRLPRAFRLRQQHIIPARQTRLTQRRPASQFVYDKRTGQPMRYQAVRFKSPGLTVRRVATIGFYTGVIYTYFAFTMRYLDLQIEIVDDLDDDYEEVGEDGEEVDDDGYAEDDSLFIPLTWATQLPRTFYRGSDPEWQDFIKIAKDKTRRKKVQDELVQIVFNGSVQHPLIGKQLGKDSKIGRYWLEISFPDGPPPEYERSGIEIGDGFVAWSQQKIGPETQWRVMRALWPTAAFNSFYATGKVLLGMQYRRIMQALGWEDRDPFSPEERYKHALDMMQKQQQNRERKEVGKAHTEPNGNPGAMVSADSRTQEAKTTSAIGGDRLPWHFPVPLPSSASSLGSGSTDIPIAMHVFASTLSKSWDPKKSEPPRGTFVVQGMVEVRGSNGGVLFDVQSCYDPKQSKFVVINAAVRNFKRWRQSPRGGP